MICTFNDSQNIGLMIDCAQAKLILAMLRTTTTKQLVAASVALQNDGFTMITGVDAEAARSSAASILGLQLDDMRYKAEPEDDVVEMNGRAN